MLTALFKVPSVKPGILNIKNISPLSPPFFSPEIPGTETGPRHPQQAGSPTTSRIAGRKSWLRHPVHTSSGWSLKTTEGHVSLLPRWRTQPVQARPRIPAAMYQDTHRVNSSELLLKLCISSFPQSGSNERYLANAWLGRSWNSRVPGFR